MSAPFSEYEKRFLLAEVIKVSNVPLETLLSIIKDEQIEPNWQEIFIPPARTLKSCLAAFNDLLSSTSAPSYLSGGFDPPPTVLRKRRHSDTEPSSSSARTLQPKPAPNGDQVAPFRSSSNILPRKRGRPTKEVLEARKADAAARGSVYLPLKSAGRKSVGAAPTAQMTFGPEGPASESGPKTGGGADTPVVTKKRRGRPPNPKDEVEAEKVSQALMSYHSRSSPDLGQMIEAASGAIQAQRVSPDEDNGVYRHHVDELQVVDKARDATLAVGSAGEVPGSTAATTQTLFQQMSGRS